MATNKPKKSLINSANLALGCTLLALGNSTQAALEVPNTPEHTISERLQILHKKLAQNKNYHFQHKQPTQQLSWYNWGDWRDGWNNWPNWRNY